MRGGLQKKGGEKLNFMLRTVIRRSAEKPQPPIPAWATRRVTFLETVLEELSVSLKAIGLRVTQFGNRLVGTQPKEALYRLPRLLTVHGHRPRILDNVFIPPSALLTGDVQVGRKVYIGYNAILRAEHGEQIVLGESSNVQEKAVVTGNTSVGKWSTIEPMAIVESAEIASCSFVGAGAIVMRGAKIESGAMLCAAAVLQAGAVIPSGEIWAGNPAERIGTLTEPEKESIIKAAKHMVLLAVEHRDSWQLTWDELENQREAREVLARVTEHNVEVRVKPFYIKEPPRPTRRPTLNRSPYEMLEGENRPPLMEGTMPGSN